MIGDFTPHAKKWGHVGAKHLAKLYVEQGWHIIFEELFESDLSLENTRKWSMHQGLPCFIFHLTANIVDVHIRNQSSGRDILTEERLLYLTQLVENSIPSDALVINTSTNSVDTCVELVMASIQTR